MPQRWVAPTERPDRFVSGREFEFMGIRGRIDDGGWDPPSLPKLWRYNLNYFDDAGSPMAGRNGDVVVGRMVRWVNENPPGLGTPWEPYPTSQRIVNWAKWSLAGNALPVPCVRSLAIQARWLRSHVEYHLYGNHLFLNGKALLFAGCIFEGSEADAWAKAGARILLREIREQILPDGGQFERSPMYHALAVEDILDLVNLGRALGPHPRHPVAAVVSECERVVDSMRHWLRAMTHPDGEISYFNDSAMGVAPTLEALDGYARRLGMPAQSALGDGLVLLEASGYVRLQLGGAVVIMDGAPLGPDYLPGHGHADTLSLEMSIHGERVLVNSGTSTYDPGPERIRQRGTAAHNTVELFGTNSSDVWGSFRVGHRARPEGLEASADAAALAARCSHDGYSHRRRGAIHSRRVRQRGGRREVDDDFPPHAGAVAHWHLRSGLDVVAQTGAVISGRREVVRLETRPGPLSVHRSTWHPRFGEALRSTRVSCSSDSGHLALVVTW